MRTNLSVTDLQEVTRKEVEKIRGLDSFDLVMLISEIHDHGWKIARTTLKLMPDERNDDGTPNRKST